MIALFDFGFHLSLSFILCCFKIEVVVGWLFGGHILSLLNKRILETFCKISFENSLIGKKKRSTSWLIQSS